MWLCKEKTTHRRLRKFVLNYPKIKFKDDEPVNLMEIYDNYVSNYEKEQKKIESFLRVGKFEPKCYLDHFVVAYLDKEHAVITGKPYGDPNQYLLYGPVRIQYCPGHYCGGYYYITEMSKSIVDNLRKRVQPIDKQKYIETKGF